MEPFQIIKFCGLTADQVSALDKLIKDSPILRTPRKWYRLMPPGKSFGHQPFVQKLRVNCGDDNSYRYELKAYISLKLADNEYVKEEDWIDIGCPRSVINAVYDAIDILPHDKD